MGCCKNILFNYYKAKWRIHIVKLSWKKVKTKNLSETIRVHEYCYLLKDLPIDAALVELNGMLGPKINKIFTELLFVISGKLIVLEGNDKHILNARDVYIIKPEIKHAFWGDKCILFVSCSPQFNHKNVEFVS
jgi:hypothetical protein